MLTAIAGFTGLLLDALPIVRTVWRWLLERNLEVRVLPPKWQQGRDKNVVQQVAIEEPGPHFATFHFAARFANHRSDRRERVVEARVEFKKWRLWLWRNTVASVPVYERTVRRSDGPPVDDLPIEPMAAPLEVQWIAEGDLEPSDFPPWFSAVLVLDMMGPIRRLERHVMDYRRPSASWWGSWRPRW